MPAPSSEPVPAEPAVEPKLGPVPKLVWPQLTKGLPQTYAELRALLPPDHELVFVPLWSPDHGKSKEEVIASAFKDVVRHDFDGNGKPDLMFVMEALPSADDEPGDRTLVAFMQGADGQLTRALEVRGLVHGAFSGDIDSFEGLKLEGERVSVAQSFGTGREASSTHHEIAYRDGDFYFVGYGSGWNDDAPNNEFYTWSSNYLDLVAGTGKSSDGLRDTTDVPLKFTPKPLVKVRDFDQGPSLDDVLPRGEPNPVVWVVRDGALLIHEVTPRGEVRVFDVDGKRCVSAVGPKTEVDARTFGAELDSRMVTVMRLANPECRGVIALPIETNATFFVHDPAGGGDYRAAAKLAYAHRAWKLEQRTFEKLTGDHIPFDHAGIDGEIEKEKAPRQPVLVGSDGRELALVSAAWRVTGRGEGNITVVVDPRPEPKVVAALFGWSPPWALAIGETFYMPRMKRCSPAGATFVDEVFSPDETLAPLGDEAERSDWRHTIIAYGKLECPDE